MVDHLHILLPVLLFTAAVYLLLAGALLRNRDGPGARTMGFAMLGIVIWLVCAVLELAAETLDGLAFLTHVKYTAIALVPPLIFLFCVEYAERIKVRAPHVAAALVIPCLTIALVWTNPWHEWMWQHPPVGPGGESLARLDWGPWYWRVHLPYSYLVVALGLVLLGAELRGESKLYRSQAMLLLAGALIPLVANVLFTLGWGSSRLGPTPLAFAVSGLFFSWGFVRLQLFRLSPVAYRAAFEHLQDGVLVTDRYDRVVDLNPAACRMTGRSDPMGAIGYRIEELLPRDPALGAVLRSAAGAQVACSNSDGRRLEVSVSAIRGAAGHLRGRVVLLRDVTGRVLAEAALRHSEALVRSIVECSPNGILRLRPVRGPAGDVRDFTCTVANPAVAAWIGRPQAELVGQPFKGAVHPHTPVLFQAFRDVVATGVACDVERSILRDGRETWLRFIAAAAGDDLVVTCVDVTERKQREREMQAAACQDPLTGLLNRRGFEADAAVLLASDGARCAALLYLDLDDFKQVNDGLGHAAGDRVLCALAARLQRCTRGPDLLARLGGDEFVLLLPDTDAAGAREVAARIVAALEAPIPLGDRPVAVAASLGIALHPRDGGDLKALVQAADRAMYEAKASGSGIAEAGGGDPAQG